MRRAVLISILLLAPWLGAGAPARLAAAGAGDPIRLRSRTIQPAGGGDLGGGLAMLEHRRDAEAAHLIIQLAAVPDAGLRHALEQRGIELQGYLPDRAFVARVAPGVTAATLADLPVRYLGELEPGDKLAPALRRGALPPHARAPGGKVALYVEVHRDTKLERLLAGLMHDLGARVVCRVRALGGAVLLVDEGDWEAIATREAVKWVEPASPQFAALNDGVREALGVEEVQGAPYGLDGAGVNVLIYDGGMVCEFHADLAGRVVRAESGPSSNHAMHVAGTVAGNGFQSVGQYRGMAPAAGIISYYYESCDPMCLYNNPQDIEDNYAEGIDVYGADFASNSIGSNIATNGYDCELEGDYENTARLVDAIAGGALGRPFASFWAAGNERQGSARCGNGYFTTGIPATAKNNIVVGATFSNVDSITGFSSYGPVDDGRMRPDVVAPGCELGGDNAVTSTRNCFAYTEMCGTSMSTPAVAGVAALILQRLRGGESDRLLPYPATYKALLAASAVDLGNPGPDYIYGYGRVDAVAAIGIVDEGFITETQITQGAVFAQSFEVEAGLPRLRAALAWDDAPGEPLSAINLVNDLDLRLVAPDQTVHRAYVLDPGAPAAPATRGDNRRDPSELVEVTAPAAGIWRLEVRGFNVPAGPQTFSVAMNVPAGATSTGIEAAADGAARRADLLLQNVPNPFNPQTTIRFTTLRGGGRVALRVYDASGRLVRVLADGVLAPGEHTVRWNGRDRRGARVASGIYFYELEHDARRSVRRMVLTR